MCDEFFENVNIKKIFITEQSSQAIMIDGTYRNKNVFIKIGFKHSVKAMKLAKKNNFPIWSISLYDELSINKKFKKLKITKNVPKMITGFICQKGTIFQDKIHEMEKLKKKEEAEMDGMFDYNKLIIMVFEKINFKSDLANFEGSFHDWLYIHKQIMDLIKILNKYGIKHNDLNFTNILINDQNEVFIIDFGNSSIIANKNNKFISHKNLSAYQNDKNDIQYYLSGYKIRQRFKKKGLSTKFMSIINKFI